MRSFLLGFLLLPAVAFADPIQVEKIVSCDKVEKVIETLTEQFQEQPVWIGQSKTSIVAVFVNHKNTSWTVVQFNEQAGCVLEIGEGFQVKTGVVDEKGSWLLRVNGVQDSNPF